MVIRHQLTALTNTLQCDNPYRICKCTGQHYIYCIGKVHAHHCCEWNLHNTATAFPWVANTVYCWLSEDYFHHRITAYTVGVCHSVTWLQNTYTILVFNIPLHSHTHHINFHLKMGVCTHTFLFIS
jgi:hypothetical protein